MSANDEDQQAYDEKINQVLDKEFHKILKDLNSTKITTNLEAIRTIKLMGDEELADSLPDEIIDKLLDLNKKSASIIVREESKEVLIQFKVSFPEDLFKVDDSMSERELLLRTLSILEKQEEQLSELESKVGCVYQFVVVLVILIVLANIFGFIGAIF